MLKQVDKRIAALATRLAGDKLEQVLTLAQSLVETEGKKPGRALADALETYKLV